MNIENKMWEMEAIASLKLVEMEDAGNFSDEYYELDGILNDINFVKDDYEGAELVQAMESLIDQLEYLLQK